MTEDAHCSQWRSFFLLSLKGIHLPGTGLVQPDIKSIMLQIFVFQGCVISTALYHPPSTHTHSHMIELIGCIANAPFYVMRRVLNRISRRTTSSTFLMADSILVLHEEISVGVCCCWLCGVWEAPPPVNKGETRHSLTALLYECASQRLCCKTHHMDHISLCWAGIKNELGARTRFCRLFKRRFHVLQRKGKKEQGSGLNSDV